MIIDKNPNQRFCRQISKLFPFSYPLEFTLKSVGHVDVDVAVGIDVDVDRHVDAEVDVEFDVGVDVEVCVDVDGDADGDVELGWRRWRWTFFRHGGHRMRPQARNLRLLQAGGGSRNEGGIQQQTPQHHCFDHGPFSICFTSSRSPAISNRLCSTIA